MRPSRLTLGVLAVACLAGMATTLCWSTAAFGGFTRQVSAGPETLSTSLLPGPSQPVAWLRPCRSGGPVLASLSWSGGPAPQSPVGAYRVERKVGSGPYRTVALVPTAPGSRDRLVELTGVACPTGPGPVPQLVSAPGRTAVSYRVQAVQRPDGTGFAGPYSEPVRIVVAGSFGRAIGA